MKRAPASAEVRDEWLRRVEAEYRSAAITQNLTLWLIQLGASPDLVRAGLRVVRDEMDHATMSHRVFVAAGGEGGPRLARESLELRRTPERSLEDDVTSVCLDVFCLGETVAVRLFKELREGCEVHAARRALDRVLRDEVRHRDFGWALLRWLIDSHGEHALARVVRELPAALGRILAAYSPAAAGAMTEVAPEDARWGLMPSARYGEVLRSTVLRDYVPRFRELGVDAWPAWSAALQSAGGPT
jgi:hypothetical protein